MGGKIKNFFNYSIVSLFTLLITLGAVIYSNYTFSTQKFYFLLILSVLVIILFVYFLIIVYKKREQYKWKIFQFYRRRLNLKGRIKKDIKLIDKGKKQKYLSVKDFSDIIENKKEYEDIPGIEKLLEEHRKQLRELSRVAETIKINDFNKKFG